MRLQPNHASQMRLQPNHAKSTQALIRLQNIFVRVKLRLWIYTLLSIPRIRNTLTFTVSFFWMKPVLKDSDYNEVDRAECQFATTTTVLDNDTKVCSFLVPEFSMLYFL